MRRLSDYLDYLKSEVLAVVGDPELPVSGASNDSRTVAPGFVFVAVSGAGDDGHRYLDRALAAGARAVISERARRLRLPSGVAAIEVRNAYAAAGLAAEVMYDFPARKLELYGITGTNGKTTTAFLLRDILSLNDTGPVGLVGTVGYDCGTGLEAAARTTPDPFALQGMFARMVENGCRRAVLEVSSHALVQHRLGRARFQRAVFTNLSGDHLDYHGTMEEYFRAKRQLFRELLAPDGIALLNGDDPYGRRLARELARRRTLAWSRRRHDCDYHLRIVRAGLRGQTCQLTGAREARRLFCPLVGDYNAENLAAAALAARSLGLSWSGIALALARTAGVPGRLQGVRFPGNALALVDYAHTDDALKKVLATLKKLPHRRLLVIFGCGGDRDRSKRPRMGAAAALADHLIITTDNPRSEDPEAIIAEIIAGIPAGTFYEVEADRARALALGVSRLGPDDILLVAGKGHEDYQEIKGRRIAFDDRRELLRLREAVGTTAAG